MSMHQSVTHLNISHRSLAAARSYAYYQSMAHCCPDMLRVFDGVTQQIRAQQQAAYYAQYPQHQQHTQQAQYQQHGQQAQAAHGHAAAGGNRDAHGAAQWPAGQRPRQLHSASHRHAAGGSTGGAGTSAQHQRSRTGHGTGEGGHRPRSPPPAAASSPARKPFTLKILHHSRKPESKPKTKQVTLDACQMCIVCFWTPGFVTGFQLPFAPASWLLHMYLYTTAVYLPATCVCC